MVKRVAIYARVSTSDQTCDNQLRDLRAIAKRNDWEIVEEFCDHGISGAKGRSQRLALDRMLNGAVRKDFDLIMSWSVDRLGRSMKDLLEILDILKTKNVDLYLHLQNLDTQTAAGRMLFSIVGIFSEFERSLIVERVKSGMARARAAGVKLGRKTKFNESTLASILALRKEGVGIKKICRQLEIGVGSYYKALKTAA